MKIFCVVRFQCEIKAISSTKAVLTTLSAVNPTMVQRNGMQGTEQLLTVQPGIDHDARVLGTLLLLLALRAQKKSKICCPHVSNRRKRGAVERRQTLLACFRPE